jgi:hypothetical protein
VQLLPAGIIDDLTVTYSSGIQAAQIYGFRQQVQVGGPNRVEDALE